MTDQIDNDPKAHTNRTLSKARVGDTSSEQARLLGPLMDLPGTWKSLPGRGWNMIALPFATRPQQRLDYRLLLNQYDEVLAFKSLDGRVPNRGIARFAEASLDTDQHVVALDYEQMVRQLAAADHPQSGKLDPKCNVIHHEPGLWLHIHDEKTQGMDIARLATVPHGDALLGLGRSQQSEGAPQIPDISGLPIGVNQDIDNPYLEPYKRFHDNLFEGLFDPVAPNELLKLANADVDIVRTTTLHVDTTVESGGINNIPFVVRQANAAEMQFTLWIQELKETDAAGQPIVRLQYSQVVMLDFFPRQDGIEGLIRWPHVSINTLVRTDQVDTPHECQMTMPG